MMLTVLFVILVVAVLCAVAIAAPAFIRHARVPVTRPKPVVVVAPVAVVATSPAPKLVPEKLARPPLQITGHKVLFRFLAGNWRVGKVVAANGTGLILRRPGHRHIFERSYAAIRPRAAATT